jgi:predicted phage terminase large subunit-like protein
MRSEAICTVKSAPALAPAQADEMLTLWEFFSECFIPFNNISLPLKPAHKEVCDILQDAILGFTGKQYVIINIPPRIGKTKILEAAACWLNAYFTDAQNLFTCFSSLLVQRSIRYIAQTIKSAWYCELFGETIGRICNSELVTTSQGGNTYGAGLDGTITGFGAGLKRRCGGFIAIDDPAKPTEALSPTVSASVRETFELTLKSRRNSDEFTPIIICAQRLAKDDLCGYVLDTYPKESIHIKIPALVVDAEGREVSNFPETYSVENLVAARNSEQSNIRFAFWSQMQQEPVSQGGNIIPIDKLLRWDCADAWHPELNGGGMRFERRVIAIDTAMKTKEHNDYSVVQLWGKRAGRSYLVDQMRGKWQSPELLRNVVEFWNKWMKSDPRGVVPLPPTRLLIEEKAAGTGLGQQLRSLGVPAEGVERNIDKVTRVKAVMPFIETGFVVVPRDDCQSAPWITEFISELAEFAEDGTAKHDDQIDVMADSLSQLNGAAITIFDVMAGRGGAEVGGGGESGAGGKGSGGADAGGRVVQLWDVLGRAVSEKATRGAEVTAVAAERQAAREARGKKDGGAWEWEGGVVGGRKVKRVPPTFPPS